MRKKIFMLFALIALVAAVGVCLVACNYNKSYTEALEAAEYRVTSLDAKAAGESINIYVPKTCEEGDCEWGLTAVRKLNFDDLDEVGQHVTVVKFTSNTAAREAYDVLKHRFGDLVFRNEKMLIWGTEDAVKIVLEKTPFASNT